MGHYSSLTHGRFLINSYTYKDNNYVEKSISIVRDVIYIGKVRSQRYSPERSIRTIPGMYFYLKKTRFEEN